MQVSCILRKRGAQMLLAYSRIMPLVSVLQVRVEEECSVSPLSFIFLFLPYPSLSSPLLSLLPLFSLSLGDNSK